jgi:diguanylate cyclase (GGDEF)-like protein
MVNAMLESAGAITLDVRTLFVVATCVTMLLGLMLLFVWAQDRIQALAWWGTAYLVGGFSVAVWSVENAIPLPVGTANSLLFFACGMIWSAARLFHGRPVLWGAMAAGAVVWLLACLEPHFAQWAMGRIALSSVIVSAYTFLTAMELRRERRKPLLRRWPAMFVPILHGAVFLFPIPLAGLLADDRGVLSLASGWFAVFVIETMLYVVGTAFIVLVLAKEETLRVQRDAASTDELTALPNRRGLLASAQQLIELNAERHQPLSALMFDLDRFKSINDRFGHHVGDEVLRLFATVARANLRASDLIGRIGGEEFFALVPGTLADAVCAAERVRAAFEAAAISVGLLIRSDTALYRAKTKGRNRVETVDQDMPTIFTTAPATRIDGPIGDIARWPVPERPHAGGPALAA